MTQERAHYHTGRPQHWLVGRRILTWFSANDEGFSRIVGVDQYRGRYPEHFTHILRITAPHTQRGEIEIAVNLPADLEHLHPEDVPDEHTEA